MATATVTGLTNITTAESTTNWSSIGGGAGATLTTDVFIQGSGAIGRRSSTGVHGFIFDFGSNIDFTVAGRYLWIWINIPLGPSGLNASSSGGLRVRVGTTLTNYGEWYVGGNDITVSGWKRYIIDLNTTPSTTGGTGLTVSQCRYFGATTNWSSVPGGNIPHLVVDSIDYGSTLTVTGGTSGDRLKWSDIYTYTDGTPATRAWGVLQEKGGVYFCNGDIQLGDTAGTGTCYLDDEDQLLIFENQQYNTGSGLVKSIPDTLQGITVAGNATGVTEIQDGNKVGTGDSAVGSKGSTIKPEQGSLNQLHFTASDADIDKVLLYGTRIDGCRNAMSFSADATNAPNHEIAGCSFDNNAQISAGRVVLRNNIFSGHTGTDAALLWNSNINIKFCAFRNNTDSTNNPAGIEHDSTTGSPFSYTGLTFSGNDNDVYNSSGGSITINSASGTNASTVRNSVGSSTTINNTQTLELTGLISNSEVRIFTHGTTTERTGTESSGTSFSWNYNYSVNDYVDIIILHTNYNYYRIDNLLLPATGTSIPIQQIADRVYNNP